MRCNILRSGRVQDCGRHQGETMIGAVLMMFVVGTLALIVIGAHELFD
jgi:hypothetical protein